MALAILQLSSDTPFAMDEPSGLVVWNRVLRTALQLPGARVDRTAFLRSALSPYLSSDKVEKAVQQTPAKAGISKQVVADASQKAIKWHQAGVSATSAVAGLPGGFWVAGTVPADVIQYFWHVLVVVQKLAYLHGWPSLLQEGEEVDEETTLVLTLFVGVMLGIQGATSGLGKWVSALGLEGAKHLPKSPLNKHAIYRLATEVAKWIGLRLTRKKLAEMLGRAMPVVGGIFAGTTTWMAFGKGTQRLKEHLESLPLAKPT